MKPNSYSMQPWGTCAAKKELMKVLASLSREQQLHQVAITKSMGKLDEGVKAIAVRHKQLGILK